MKSSRFKQANFSNVPVTFQTDQHQQGRGEQDILNNRSIRLTTDAEHSLQRNPSTYNESNEPFSPSNYGIKGAQRHFNVNINGAGKEMFLNNSRSKDKPYQYGDQGVNVCEEVVERYKASNYSMQGNILERFKKDAEEFRRNRNKHNRQEEKQVQYAYSPPPQMRILNPSQSNQSFANQKHFEKMRQNQYDLELHRRNRVILENQEREQQERDQLQREKDKQLVRQRKRQRNRDIYVQREKENLNRVGNMLREIDHKIKLNSQTITDSLNGLRKQLKPAKSLNQVKIMRIIQNQCCEDMNESDFQNLSSLKNESSKLPIVLYNDRYFAKKTEMEEQGLMFERLNRNCYQNKSQNMTNIARVLRKNEERLKILSSVKKKEEQLLLDC